MENTTFPVKLRPPPSRQLSGAAVKVISAIRAQLPVPQWLVPLELVKRFLVRSPSTVLMVGWLMKQATEVASQVLGVALLSVFIWRVIFTCGFIQRLKFLEKPTRMSWVAYRSYGPEVFDLFNMDAKLLHDLHAPSTLIGRSKTQARISKSLLSGHQSRLQFRRIITSSEKKLEKKMLPLDLKSWLSAGWK